MYSYPVYIFLGGRVLWDFAQLRKSYKNDRLSGERRTHVQVWFIVIHTRFSAVALLLIRPHSYLAWPTVTLEGIAANLASSLSECRLPDVPSTGEISLWNSVSQSMKEYFAACSNIFSFFTTYHPCESHSPLRRVFWSLLAVHVLVLSRTTTYCVRNATILLPDTFEDRSDLQAQSSVAPFYQLGGSNSITTSICYSEQIYCHTSSYRV
ncbi:hypothetical protein AcW1_002399 [Taiwanofungus camphoratus]|nr:hypothetical protein AcV5_010408 [Antrodia cinnamomea]KAI0937918.1 hypothetical protein AcV7_003252 [Antrodia cinnamomea]KAI0944769.1 hypothetical protein AcW1_002399 [Antrodia cinnamomea]